MNALVNPLMPQLTMPRQQNPLMGLASNPLLAIGTQLLNNSQAGPTFRPMFQGVPQAMAQAGQQGMMLEQFERQREDDTYRRGERARKDAERERRVKGIQGLNPLDPEDLGRQLIATGDPELAMEGFKILTKAPTGQKPVMVMGADGPTYVRESESYGKPAVVPGMLPKTPEQMAQARELAMARGGQSGEPANIREWREFQAMPPEQQQQYLIMKRANPYLNLGGEMVQPNPIQAGASMGGFEKSLPPQDLPETKAAQASATMGAEIATKRSANMSGISGILDQAEEILKKEGPTGSSFGAAIDAVTGAVGVSLDSAESADKLSAIGGALISKMPRMEGPQSNYDVQNYREMAGQVGNRQLPVERRLAALQAVRQLWGKYERLNQGQPSTGGWSITPVNP